MASNKSNAFFFPVYIQFLSIDLETDGLQA